MDHLRGLTARLRRPFTRRCETVCSREAKRMRPCSRWRRPRPAEAGWRTRCRRRARSSACTPLLIHDDLPAMEQPRSPPRSRPTTRSLVRGSRLGRGTPCSWLLSRFWPGEQRPRYPMALHLGIGGGREVDDRGAGGRSGRRRPASVGPPSRHPPAADLGPAAMLGASGGDERRRPWRPLQALSDFGYHVGLGVPGHRRHPGRDPDLGAVGEDRREGRGGSGKATYPAIVGLERSRDIARRLTVKAFAALKPLRRGTGLGGHRGVSRRRER